MTVPYWDKLSSEVLRAILEHVQNLDQLRQCQLTCKSWQKCAQSMVFKTIVLSKENDVKFINGVQTRFFEYISKIKYYELIFSFADDSMENEADMISRYIHATRVIRTALGHSVTTIGKVTYNEDNYRFYSNSFKISSYPGFEQDYVNVLDLNFFFSFTMRSDIGQLLCKRLVDEVAKYVDEFHFSGHLWNIPAGQPVPYDSELRDVFKWFIGECIKDCIKNCTLLKTLEFGCIEVVDNYSTSPSINVLVLGYCDITSSQSLTKLSTCLPALKHLTLVGYTGKTRNMKRRGSNLGRLIVIDMPDTSLETLTWKGGYYSRHDEKRHSLPVINKNNLFILNLQQCITHNNQYTKT